MYLLIKGKKPQPEGLDGLRNLPSNTLYTETLSANSMVPVNKQQGNSQFGMLPKDVMSRTDLTPADKLLLTVLNMESYSSGRVLLSHAALSRSSGVGRTGEPLRSMYIVMSAMFRSKFLLKQIMDFAS
jgi:hypothetical protein